MIPIGPSSDIRMRGTACDDGGMKEINQRRFATTAERSCADSTRVRRTSSRQRHPGRRVDALAQTSVRAHGDCDGRIPRGPSVDYERLRKDLDAVVSQDAQPRG